MLETLLKDNDKVERCGLILTGDRVVELPNVAQDPANSYDMDPTELVKYLDDAVGSWHTHPDSDPVLSGEDYIGFLAYPNLIHAIIGRRDGKVLMLRYKVEDGLVLLCD